MKKVGLIFPVLLSVAGCSAQSGLSTKSVYMYTNGLTYVVSAGQVKCPDGTFILKDKEIPPALSGTIWFSSGKGISHVTFRHDTIRKAEDAINVMQLLKANTGRRVSITTMIGNKEGAVYSGAIEAVVYDTLGTPDPNEGYVMLKTEKGSVTLLRPVLFYSAIAFEGESTHRLAQNKVTGHLTVNFKGKTDQADLNMAWVQQQAAWEPQYRMQLKGSNKARLTMNAEISSPGVEMKDAELNLVIADPEMLAGSRQSRLTGRDQWYALNYADADGEEDAAKNVAAIRAVAGESSDVTVAGGKAEDYYIYRLKNINIRKGAYAQVPVLAADLDVSHIYQSTLPPASEYLSAYQSDPSVPVYFPAFHKIRTKNTGSEPWARAPLLLEGEDKSGTIMLGQTMMPATAPGEQAYVTVAQVSDLAVQHSEEETAREQGALKIPAYSNYTAMYDLVTVKVKMRVANRSNEVRQVMLNRQVAGKMLSSDLTWQVVTLKPQAGSPNSNSQVSWDLSLKPGEEKTIVYTYQIYIKTN